MAMESRDLFENPVRYTAGEVTIEPESSYLLKEGMAHTDVVDVKMKLNWLGYGQSKITKKFGSYFKEQVMKFQADYDLAVTGMVDYRTNRKIGEIFSIAFRPDDKHKRIRRFASALERLGFGEIVDKAHLKRCLMDFQKHYELKVTASLDFVTFTKMNETLSTRFQTGEEHKDIITLKEQLNSLGYGRIKLTPKFGKKTERMVMKFQEDYGLLVSGIADEITMEKLNAAQRIKEKVTYSRYDIKFGEVLEKQREAAIENHPIMLNPNNFVNDEKMKFLFIDLFRQSVTSASELNKLLIGKGELEGQGHVVIEIANEWNINELFLVSRLLNYTSASTTKDDGGLESVIAYLAKQLQSEYGPLNNTLYKMFFNPANVQDEQGRMIKDINWLTNQLEVLYKSYQSLDSYTLYLDIPVFKDRPVEKYIRG